jgi:hypothetical protein
MSDYFILFVLIVIACTLFRTNTYLRQVCKNQVDIYKDKLDLHKEQK